MRSTRVTLLAALTVIFLGFPLHVHAAPDDDEPVVPECGEGRTWWPPLQTCVTLPVLKKRVDPEYVDPAPGLDYGALLYLHVSAKGNVADVQIVKAPLEGEETPEGEAVLSAFVHAVRQWTFEPGFDDWGTPVAMTVILKIRLKTEA
jgi:hypothetical protein